MKVINIGFLRCKLLECRISSIEEKIEKLHELDLFFQIRFDIDRSEKISNKIKFLSNRKMELMAMINNTAGEFSNEGVFA